jgi:hypothetical protein
MTKLKLFGALCLVGSLLAGPAWAEPVEFEGPFSGIDNSDPGSNKMIVNGVRIVVPAGTPIHSPTNSALTFSQLHSGPAFLGRTQNGFLGGTGIVEGEVDTLTGIVTATDVFVEPAENVMVGTLSPGAICTTPHCDGPGDVLKINGTPVVPSTDERMPSDGPKTRGFDVNLAAGTLANLTVGAEGYFGNDDMLHYFALDITGAPLANPNTQEVSVEVFKGRQRKGGCEYTGRGFTHTPALGSVEVRANGVPICQAATPAPAGGGGKGRGRGGTNVPTPVCSFPTIADEDPSFGLWNFRVTATGNCAAEVEVRFGPANTTSAVDLRIDE